MYSYTYDERDKGHHVTIDEVKRFIMENKKGLIVGAIVALALRAMLR